MSRPNISFVSIFAKLRHKKILTNT